MREVHTKSVHLRIAGRGCHASFVRTHLHYLLSCFWLHFCLIVSCFICRNLTLPLFKKDVFVRNEIITWNWMYELSHELLNDLRLRILRNEDNLTLFIGFSLIKWFLNLWIWTRNSWIWTPISWVWTRGFELTLWNFDSCF